ncbi:uncharacterized protein LOC135499425 [Lineus longissimus]|uniref:uncharacterized protein LOC135499425 n=1 Tax=Lineus longissimus TaxID=88925 RepID=UPI00315D32E4
MEKSKDKKECIQAGTSASGGGQIMKAGPKKRCRALSTLIQCIRAIRYDDGKLDATKPISTEIKKNLLNPRNESQDVQPANAYYPLAWSRAMSLDEVAYQNEPDLNKAAFKEKLGLPTAMRLDNVLDPSSLPVAVTKGHKLSKRLPTFEIPKHWLPPSRTPLLPEDCSALDIERKSILVKKKSKKVQVPTATCRRYLSGRGAASQAGTEETSETMVRPQQDNAQSSVSTTVDADNFTIDMDHVENLHLFDYDEFEHAQYEEAENLPESVIPNQYWLRGSPNVALAVTKDDEKTGHQIPVELGADTSSSTDSDDYSSHSQSPSRSSACYAGVQSPSSRIMVDTGTTMSSSATATATRPTFKFKTPYNTRGSSPAQTYDPDPDELPNLQPSTIRQCFNESVQGSPVIEDFPAAKRRRESPRVVKKSTAAPLCAKLRGSVGNNNNNAGFDESLYNLMDDLLVSSSSSEDTLPEFDV